jgi:hypothetical protein
MLQVRPLQLEAEGQLVAGDRFSEPRRLLLLMESHKGNLRHMLPAFKVGYHTVVKLMNVTY